MPSGVASPLPLIMIKRSLERLIVGRATPIRDSGEREKPLRIASRYGARSGGGSISSRRPRYCTLLESVALPVLFGPYFWPHRRPALLLLLALASRTRLVSSSAACKRRAPIWRVPSSSTVVARNPGKTTRGTRSSLRTQALPCLAGTIRSCRSPHRRGMRASTTLSDRSPRPPYTVASRHPLVASLLSGHLPDHGRQPPVRR